MFTRSVLKRCYGTWHLLLWKRELILSHKDNCLASTLRIRYRHSIHENTELWQLQRFNFCRRYTMLWVELLGLYIHRRRACCRIVRKDWRQQKGGAQRWWFLGFVSHDNCYTVWFHFQYQVMVGAFGCSCLGPIQTLFRIWNVYGNVSREILNIYNKQKYHNSGG